MIAAPKVKKLALVMRVAAQQMARSRTGGAVLKGLRATAASFGKVAHQLWLEVTGFTFLAIAAIVFAILRAGVHLVFTVGWWRLW